MGRTLVPRYLAAMDIGHALRTRFSPRAGHPIYDVWRTGRALFGIEDMETRRKRAHDEEHLALL